MKLQRCMVIRIATILKHNPITLLIQEYLTDWACTVFRLARQSIAYYPSQVFIRLTFCSSMIRKEYIFLSLPVIVIVVIKPSIVPTLLYVSLLHTKDSPLSNNRLARNVVVLLHIISDIIIPLNRDAVGLNDYSLKSTPLSGSLSPPFSIPMPSGLGRWFFVSLIFG